MKRLLIAYFSSRDNVTMPKAMTFDWDQHTSVVSELMIDPSSQS